MIDNRIKINFDKMEKRYTKIWYDFINDKNYAFFKNIIDITFARPRDMICFFATVSDMKTNFPLTQKEKQNSKKIIAIL